MSDFEMEYDEAYFESDEDDFAIETNQKKVMPFKIHSFNQIMETVRHEEEHISGVLGVEEAYCASLLKHVAWNKEKLIEEYISDSDALLRNAGIVMKKATQKRRRGFVCDICCDDDKGLVAFALGCGHYFCTTCVTYYLEQKIRKEGEWMMNCPGDCSAIFDEASVKSLVDSPTFSRYRELIAQSFVLNKKLKWCSTPECNNAVEYVQFNPLQVVPIVKCECDQSWCFGCELGNHEPCICKLANMWNRKCKDDSETANWMNANTKECPKCRSTIEKNGGCNHMSCKKCKHEFCWVCLGPWTEHGTQYYNCNRFDEKSSTEARDAKSTSRAALERYLHYYNRFANHEQSAKLSQGLLKKTEEKMAHMQSTTSLSWIEVQFLKNAVDVVVECLTTLKWTYAFAFYLERNNMTHLFEDNQRDLEVAIEQLSELLEKPLDSVDINELKKTVLDKSAYCGSRREVVIKDTAVGLSEGRWEYNVDIK